MSKRNLLSVALVGGLAATSANAVEIQPTGSNTGTDIIAGVADDLLLFGGDADDLSLTEDLILGPIIEAEDEPVGDVEIKLADTIYGGTSGNGLRASPGRSGIEPGKGLKAPNGITLDNGLKKPNKLKPASSGRKLRGAKRKKRN